MGWGGGRVCSVWGGEVKRCVVYGVGGEVEGCVVYGVRGGGD